MKLIAVIPAFNEAKQIAPVIQQTRKYVSEVVVIDDGSADETSAVARQAGAHVIVHPQNQGKGASILTGLDYFRDSGADAVMLLDADGQHDPVEIPQFVAKAASAGLVVGTRMMHTDNMPRARRWTNQFMSWLTGKLARQPVPDSQCGYRLLRREVLPALKFSTARFETETEMLIQAGRAGHRIESVPIRTIYLPGRRSHIRPIVDTVRFCKMVVKYW